MIRYALLVDGGFLTKRFGAVHKRAAVADDVTTICDQIGLQGDLGAMRRLRTLYYDAPPASFKVRNPLSGKNTNLKSSAMYSERTRMLSKLKGAAGFAVREGVLANRGWRLTRQALESLAKDSSYSLGAADLQVNLEQKGVDLRVGLDMARLALRAIVDVIVVVTGDSDFIPAFKFARREGLQVYLEPLGSGAINKELVEHSDRVLSTDLSAIQFASAPPP